MGMFMCGRPAVPQHVCWRACLWCCFVRDRCSLVIHIAEMFTIFAYAYVIDLPAQHPMSSAFLVVWFTLVCLLAGHTALRYYRTWQFQNGRFSLQGQPYQVTD